MHTKWEVINLNICVWPRRVVVFRRFLRFRNSAGYCGKILILNLPIQHQSHLHQSESFSLGLCSGTVHQLKKLSLFHQSAGRFKITTHLKELPTCTRTSKITFSRIEYRTSRICVLKLISNKA